MIFYRLKTVRSIAFIGVVTLTLCLGAYAQESDTAADTAADVPPPEPLALANDWWSYFEDAGDQLSERIDLFKSRLQSTKDAARVEEVSNIVDEINRSLGLYVELRERKPAAPAEPPAILERYDLASVLELVGQIRDLQLEVDLEREEIDHRDKGINQARRQFDTLRAAYFASGKRAPTRLSQGLTIIRDRMRLVLAQEELRLLKPNIANNEERVKTLRKILASASQRLVASGEDVESYEQLYELANAEVIRLNDEAAFYRLRTAGVSETAEDNAKARRFRQRLIDFDVRIATAELTQWQAQVAVALTSRINPEPDEGDNLDLRQLVSELEQRLKDTEAQRSTWRRATDNERDTAETQLSLTQSQNSALTEIHRTRIELTDDTLQALAELRESLAKGKMLAELAADRLAQEEGRLAAWFTDLKQSLWQLGATLARLSSESLFTINETPVTLVGLIRILIILAIAWWLSKIVRHALDRVSQRSDVMNRASLYTIGRLFHYAILVIGILVGLSSIGLDFTKLALFVSALGVGLGFGLQAIFSNFVAGLIILFEKSLKVGDFVDLESGVTGEVKEINIRSTLVTTNDNIDILVPNSEFVSGRVINWTLREAHRRLRIPFGVAYGTDKELVKKAALEAAANVSFTMTSPARRQPQVWLIGFGDSSLNFELVVWLKPEAVNRPAATHAAYTWEIETALGKYGIEIPFPQRDLHLRSGFSQVLSDSTKDETTHDANPHLVADAKV